MAVAPPLSYRVEKTRKQPGIGGHWDSPDRVHAGELSIANFCRDSAHEPVTDLKMLYDDTQLYGVFRVRDRYVLCRETEYQADVTRDACVAAYIQPCSEGGYLALEFNCCGTMRAQYVEAPGLGKGVSSGRVVALPWRWGHQIRVYTSQYGSVVPEQQGELTWYVEFVIPFAVFEEYMGAPGCPGSAPWYANFYKCSSACSHPHRASWAPLASGISFHQPDCFAPLYFE